MPGRGWKSRGSRVAGLILPSPASGGGVIQESLILADGAVHRLARHPFFAPSRLALRGKGEQIGSCGGFVPGGVSARSAGLGLLLSLGLNFLGVGFRFGTELLDIVCAKISLAKADAKLVGEFDSHFRLKDKLKEREAFPWGSRSISSVFSPFWASA